MARLLPVLRAVASVTRRDAKSIGSFATNNFFLVSVILLQRAGSFLYLLLGLVLLFPLSADPLRKVPADRLALWPLDNRQRRLLRVFSPWLNPAAWVIGAVLLFAVGRMVSVGIVGVILAFVATGFLVSLAPESRRQGIFRSVPRLPGRFGELVRLQLRHTLATLDFYMALFLGLSGLVFRLVAREAAGEAAMGLTILIVLALSSFGQCLFGLDGPHGVTRLRLLPAPGWQILLAKDTAFLLIATVLTLPLVPVAGVAAALAAVAVGNWPSVSEPREQARWRFSTGGPFGISLLQAFALASAAVTAQRMGPLILLGCVALLAASLAVIGRMLDRQAVDQD